MSDTPNWIQEHADELGDLAHDPTLSRYNDLASLAKGLIEKQQMIGSMTRIPSKDASDEVRNEFFTKLESVPGVVRMPLTSDDTDAWDSLYKKMGRPDDPDGYTLDGAKLPEDMPFDQDRFDAIKKSAHGMGLNNKQLQRLLETDAEFFQGKKSQAEKALGKQVENLKREWGADYERRVAQATNTALAKGGEDLESFFEAFPEAKKHPGLLKTFEKISRDYNGDQPRVEDNPIAGAPTPSEANQRIVEIRQNPDHPYNSRNLSPKQKRAVMQEMFKLQCYAQGKKPSPEGLAEIAAAY